VGEVVGVVTVINIVRHRRGSLVLHRSRRPHAVVVYVRTVYRR
jgi:hypothetical protein